MTERKFTDDEVIKALRCCVGTLMCIDCPYSETDDCAKKNTEDAIAIINRQKTEIERLRKYYFTHDYHECHNEAIKEFAERLKEHCMDETTDNINDPCVRILYDAEETIDNLVKEMTEGGGVEK